MDQQNQGNIMDMYSAFEKMKTSAEYAILMWILGATFYASSRGHHLWLLSLLYPLTTICNKLCMSQGFRDVATQGHTLQFLLALEIPTHHLLKHYKQCWL